MRLEIEGFGAFREPAAVDFEGVDLFALTGATGAGKTTVVDAICFALYGCVSRYDDKRLVAPVISQGRNEAKVRLDFAVHADRFSAVRVVRRTKGAGATTREATLERADGEVMAKNERELGAAVESLLGLSYDHFVKCVVLPQGDFARFLHDKPEKRQELLVELLDIGVYERMGRLARERDRLASAEIEATARRLDELAEATPEALAGARRRVGALARLLDDLDEAAPRLARLEAEATTAAHQADVAGEQVVTLGRIVVPVGIAELGRALTAATAALEESRQVSDGAEAATAAAAARVNGLPARVELELACRAHADASDQRAQRAKGQEVLATCRAAETTAATELATAQVGLDAARAALDRAQGAHRAHAVVDDLVAGAPCPVCRQTVTELPEVTVPAGLDDARGALRAAEVAAERAGRAHGSAGRERERIELKLESIGERVGQLETLLVSHPDAATVESMLDEVGEAEAERERARARESVARERLQRAHTTVRDEAAREADARSGYDTARDSVAGLGPPPRSGGGLVGDWAALASWAADEVVVRRRVADEAVERGVALARTRSELVAALDERTGHLGVDAAGRPRRDAVVEAVVRAEHEAVALGQAWAEAETVRSRSKELGEQAAVARALGHHLSAKGFEKWILDEALGLLVAGATTVLHELSAGQYSLTLDDRTSNFAVIDHRNADERRPARSLSGGETFLASLALALALADQLASLAARGAARLESIFLDEGFGTLDPETLDTVAAAIEELGSRERMVGLISHVPELAARVPVRFEVTKEANSASIRRIDQ